MSYKVDPRKNYAALVERLKTETDPIIRRNLETTIKHSKAEAAADFPTLMSTVSERAAYTSYTTGAAAVDNSPKGKDGVAAYYKMIVESGCHQIEHAVERVVADRHAISTDGDFTMAYPTHVLKAMGFDVSDTAPYYLYKGRMLIVWGFDENGLVTCEDSYPAGAGFEGIGERPCQPSDIYSGSH
jgi:hypothetical protein